MYDEILRAGFTFADLSAEAGLPPAICAECAATKGMRHAVSDLAGAYCKHSSMGAIRAAPRPWRLVGPIDAADFFYDFLRGPGLATAALAPDRDPNSPLQ